MNRSFKYLGLAFGALLLLQGCNLEREPNDYINYEKSFETVRDAKAWDNGIYSSLRGKFGGGYILPQEVQADMLNAHANYGGLYGAFHDWTSLRSDDDNIKEIYHSYYAALTDVNIVIERIPQLMPAASDEEKQQLNEYMGHAYLARAFYHFNLALRWGIPYAKGEGELCVPLSTKALSIEKPGRATNKEAYDLILADLDRAEKNLATVEGHQGADEITVDVVRALRARVYLYMNKMTEALAESQKLIDGGKYPLIEPNPNVNYNEVQGENNPFIAMWHHDSGVEQIWQPFVDKPNELPTTTGLYGADMTTWQNHLSATGEDLQFNKPAYFPSGSYVVGVKDNDLRLHAYLELTRTTVNDPNDPSEQLFVVSKYKGNPKYRTLDSKHWGGYVPNGIAAPKPFRIAEQYLIAAEAAYDTQQEELAKEYLNKLRKSRGLEEVVSAGENLRDAIREERAMELAFEGYRLWDLRRWGLPVTVEARKSQADVFPQIDAKYFSSDFANFKEIPADHPKFVWGFPKDEVAEINKNIKQNPGW